MPCDEIRLALVEVPEGPASQWLATSFIILMGCGPALPAAPKEEIGIFLLVSSRVLVLGLVRELDETVDVGKAFLASVPCRNLMADVDFGVIWEAPAQHVYGSVKELDAFGLAQPPSRCGLHQTVNCKNGRLTGAVHQCSAKQFLGSIAKAKKNKWSVV